MHSNQTHKHPTVHAHPQLQITLYRVSVVYIVTATIERIREKLRRSKEEDGIDPMDGRTEGGREREREWEREEGTAIKAQAYSPKYPYTNLH